MNTIRFIGDVHGMWTQYRRVITDCTFSIQVGDFGIGFPGWQKTDPQKIKGDHYFIRGNHDNPVVCQQHPNYLGDFGFKEDWGRLFFLGGGLSIDQKWRIQGRDWWPEEEVAYGILMNEVLPLYEKSKPDIVVTHECPMAIRTTLFSHHEDNEANRSRTIACLNSLFETHKPKFWFHGHHHLSQRKNILGTQFISLGMNADFYDHVLEV
jgi:hypothetical protein